MENVCSKKHCTGCMACAELCPKGAIKIEDNIFSYNTVIDSKACINCGTCRLVCQINQNVELTFPKECFQGWIGNEQIRLFSSSGGAAISLARSFLNKYANDGVVCSCVFEKGVFNFKFIESKNELGVFSGSKYVKSNPYGTYKETIKRLKDDYKVLFIGLPCQVSALKTIVNRYAKKNAANLYTVDLICHGTPSPTLLKSFLKQNHISIKNVKTVQFRHKSVYGLSHDNISLSVPGTCDHYSLAYLCGLINTDNCYECKFASLNRASDITVGDSWGTELNQEEQKKGISLILCQTEKGSDLLKSSEMKLYPVELDKAKKNNDQLGSPLKKTQKRERFVHLYSKNKNFKQAVFLTLPFKCVKQKIKGLLLKAKIGISQG